MVVTRTVWKLGLFALLAMAVGLVAAACGSGISKEQYDSVQQQLAAEQQKAAALQQQISTKDKAVADAQAAAAAKDKQLADMKKGGMEPGMTVLEYAKAVPTPTPRPTATPLPAGVPTPTAAPAATPEPTLVNEVVPYAFYVETLITSSVSKFGYASFPACVPGAIFKRGSKLVWRFEVFDTSTGKRVTSLDGATIKIVLPHGEELTPRYSKRGGTGPWTWASGWDIPMDYPLGAFDYTIKVTSKDGSKSYTWKTPALVNKDRGIDSRVQIIE